MKERQVVDLPIDSILPNRFQPRIKYDEQQIYELSESIKTHGVFQPIIVRKLGEKYEIIAGERRYKASILAGKLTIPAITMEINDKDSIEIALIENVQRTNLTPIEEAISYKKILDMGYIKQDELAKKLGKTQSTVANKIRLLNLDESVQEALLENKISERHARSLLKLKSTRMQEEMLKRIINERMTVRKTDDEIEKLLEQEKETEEDNIPVVIDELIEEDNKMNNNEQIQNQNKFIFSPNEHVETAPNTMLNSTVIQNENNVIDETKLNQSVVNPYDNLNNMQQTAQQINQEKEANDISMLLKPEDKEEELEQKIEPTYQQGRFFNVPVSHEENQDENQYAKNFSFDNLYDNVKPTENSIVNEYNVPNIDLGESIDASEVIDEDEDNQNISTNNVENMFNVANEDKKVVDIVDDNIIDIEQTDDDNIPLNSNVFEINTPVVNNEDILPSVDTINNITNDNIPTSTFDYINIDNNKELQNQSVPPINEVVSYDIPNQNVVEPINNNTFEQQNNFTSNSTNYNEQEISPFSVPTVSSIDDDSQSLYEDAINLPQADIIDETSQNPNVENQNINDFMPNIGEVNSNSVQTGIDSTNNNLMQSNNKIDNEAVKIIKEAVTNLKQKGYRIDIDEFDLETMEQLIIKIQK